MAVLIRAKRGIDLDYRVNVAVITVIKVLSELDGEVQRSVLNDVQRQRPGVGGEMHAVHGGREAVDVGALLKLGHLYGRAPEQGLGEGYSLAPVLSAVGGALVVDLLIGKLLAVRSLKDSAGLKLGQKIRSSDLNGVLLRGGDALDKVRDHNFNKGPAADVALAVAILVLVLCGGLPAQDGMSAAVEITLAQTIGERAVCDHFGRHGVGSVCVIVRGNRALKIQAGPDVHGACCACAADYAAELGNGQACLVCCNFAKDVAVLDGEDFVRSKVLYVADDAAEALLGGHGPVIAVDLAEVIAVFNGNSVVELACYAADAEEIFVGAGAAQVYLALVIAALDGRRAADLSRDAAGVALKAVDGGMVGAVFDGGALAVADDAAVAVDAVVRRVAVDVNVAVAVFYRIRVRRCRLQSGRG